MKSNFWKASDLVTRPDFFHHFSNCQTPFPPEFITQIAIPCSIMAICSTCRTIDLSRMVDLYKYTHFTTEGRKKIAIGFPHHKTYAALRESATSGGCGACALFYEASNADPRYPNKPGIGEDDAVSLFILSGDGSFRRLVADGGRERVVVTGLKVSLPTSVFVGRVKIARW